MNIEQTSKNIFTYVWVILGNLSRETKNLHFDICKSSLRKNLTNRKPLTSFSMEQSGAEYNFYLPNFTRRV